MSPCLGMRLPCLGRREAAWLTLWIWRQILVNSNGGFWLAMDRVGVCHPEMALEMLLCQFCSFHAYDAQMHSPCCFKTSPWQSRPIRGLLWRVSLYFWRQMGYSIIQSACVHHSLNPQPKAIISKTMIVAIVFPLRLLWVMWPFTANQLLACFPLQLL